MMRTAHDVLELRMPRGLDARARERLRALVVTDVTLRNTSALRRFLEHVLAALGGLLVAGVLIVDDPSSEPWRTLALTWMLGAVVAGVSAVVEWQLRSDVRRLLRSAEEDQPPRDRRSGRTA